MFVSPTVTAASLKIQLCGNTVAQYSKHQQRCTGQASHSSPWSSHRSNDMLILKDDDNSILPMRGIQDTLQHHHTAGTLERFNNTAQADILTSPYFHRTPSTTPFYTFYTFYKSTNFTSKFNLQTRPLMSLPSLLLSPQNLCHLLREKDQTPQSRVIAAVIW